MSGVRRAGNFIIAADRADLSIRELIDGVTVPAD